MTEPVAYLVSQEPLSSVRYVTDHKPVGVEPPLVTPLYTAEQLYQRVKMTQKQLNAFTQWNKRNKGLSPVELIWNVMGANDYPDEFDIELQGVSRDCEYLLSLANIWKYFNPDKPEEMIEIVPDMKWFVRSKKQYQPDMDQGISESGYLYLTQGDIYSIEYYEMTTLKDEAQQFGTKEQAEEWVNPLTEAVLLNVYN